MELEMPKQLPNVEFRKLVKSTRDPKFKKKIYEAQEQREIVKKVKAKLLDTQLAECRFEINLQNPQSISAILSKIKNLKDIKRIYISSINYK